MAFDVIQRIATNLARVEARITAACLRAQRPRSQVTLVAVSKTRSVEEIWAAYQCGVRHFGENRIEELGYKVPLLAERWVQDPPTWHMIGHLQSRKAGEAVQYAQVLHSLDSLSLARKLDMKAGTRGSKLPVLVECNVSGEITKYGFHANDPDNWEPLAAVLAQLEHCSNLRVQGLMTMAPATDQPETARPVFTKLRQLQAFVRVELPFSPWGELSMGMSDDFTVAIEEGATMVRVGRAIFADLETEH